MVALKEFIGLCNYLYKKEIEEKDGGIDDWANDYSRNSFYFNDGEFDGDLAMEIRWNLLDVLGFGYEVSCTDTTMYINGYPYKPNITNIEDLHNFLLELERRFGEQDNDNYDEENLKNFITIAMWMQANCDDNIYYNVSLDMKMIREINSKFIQYNAKMSYGYSLTEFLDEEMKQFTYHEMNGNESVWVRQ